MSRPREKRPLEFGGPATYRIVVQGRLEEELSERLGGMRITTQDLYGRASEATLVGYVRDQAELSGVLDTLYGMHLPILRVEKIDGDEQ